VNVPHSVHPHPSPYSTAVPPPACLPGLIQQLVCRSSPVIPPSASSGLGCTIPVILRFAISMLCSLSLFPLLSITTFPSVCSALDVHRALSHVSRLIVSTLPYHPITFSCIKPPLRSKLVAQLFSCLTLAILAALSNVRTCVLIYSFWGNAVLICAHPGGVTCRGVTCAADGGEFEGA